jgi:diphosphomevalonate decarboxylase
MASTAIATPNIALIKYWGNRNDELRFPAADSLSMTLDSPTVTVTVDHAPALKVTSYDPKGMEKVLSLKTIGRFAMTVQLMKQYLGDALPGSLFISIRSRVPESLGLASSAAVFCALAEAVADLVKEKAQLSREAVSVLARLGSGSAARSVFGGFVSLTTHYPLPTTHSIDSSFALQIASPEHWPLHDIILVPSREAKKVSSTEGHALAHTSPHFKNRIAAIPGRMKRCIDAIKTKNFPELQDVAEEDALDMHHVMETQDPPLNYLNAETHRIIREIKELRSKKNLDVLFTMDAGPTVHLICTEAARKEVEAYAKRQNNCEVFLTKIGAGSQVE